MKKKTFQEWCVDTLVYILKNREAYRGKLEDKGYNYSIDAIVKHYASMYYCNMPNIAQRGKEHVNLWWDQILLSERRKMMLRSVLMSESARNVVLSNSFIPDDANQVLHWEHIVPCAKVIERLFGLMIVDTNSVAQCFRHNKIALIHKTEANILDGRGVGFEQKDLELVQRWWPEEYAAAETCRNDRPKKGGTALLRLARLYNNGVKFCTYEDGNELPPSRWLEYLNDPTYLLGQTCFDGIDRLVNEDARKSLI